MLTVNVISLINDLAIIENRSVINHIDLQQNGLFIRKMINQTCTH